MCNEASLEDAAVKELCGPIEMGGVFTVMKVREAPGDYRDPGSYEHPQGTVASVDSGSAGEAVRRPKTGETPGMEMPTTNHGGHHNHQ